MKNTLVRIWNFFFGWLGLKIGELEAAHPEVIYANQLRAMKIKYQKAKDAAAQLKALHMRLVKQDEQGDLARTEAQQLLEAAIEANDDRSATELIERISDMEVENETVEAEIAQAKKDIDGVIVTLNEVSTEIRKLEKEKNTMIAKMKSAEARLEVQAAFDDLNPDADREALNGVREAIENKVAKAQFNSELKADSHEGRMAQLRKVAQKKAAGDKLQELKAARLPKTGTV
jgi:phage shock protein A